MIWKSKGNRSWRRLEKEAILSTKPLGRCSLWNYHIQPESLEQINTNYFKAEALCWGFSEYSWWSFLASFGNLVCEPLSRFAEHGCCKAREGATTSSHHALKHPCATSICSKAWKYWWRMDFIYESFVGQKDPKSSSLSRIRSCLGSLLQKTRRGPHGPFKQPQLQMRSQRSLGSTNWTLVPSQSKEGHCMFLNQCSWGHTSPSPCSKKHASSSSQRSHSLGHYPASFTENSSCSYWPYPNGLGSCPGSKLSPANTAVYCVWTDT